jgi:hypothetical protein
MAVRDEGYSPPPTRNRPPVFPTPRKEVYTSTSSVTRQPRLSSCSQTLPMDSFSQKRAYFSALLSILGSKTCFSSLLDIVLSTLLSCRSVSFPPELPPFFPSLVRLREFESQFVVRPRILIDGYPAPSPH